MNTYPVTVQEMDRVAKSIGLTHYNDNAMKKVCLMQRLGFHATIERYDRELINTLAAEERVKAEVVNDAALAIDPEQEPDWDGSDTVSESVTVTKFDENMALHGHAYNSARLQKENEARKELHEAYNKLFK